MALVPMKRVSTLLLVAVLLSGCGLLDKLFGGDASEQHKKPGPEDPIASEQLLGVLPPMDGWQTRNKAGKVTTVGSDKVSLATARYEKTVDDKVQSVDLEVMDGNYVSSVYSPFAVMAHSQGQVLDAHKLRIDIQGHPGMEEWQPEAGSVQVLLLVARRFVITLRGQNIPPGAVRQTLEAVDLQKLATWAAADAPPSH